MNPPSFTSSATSRNRGQISSEQDATRKRIRRCTMRRKRINVRLKIYIASFSRQADRWETHVIMEVKNIWDTIH